MPKLPLFLLVLLLTAACAGQKPAGPARFHPPQTAAEKALEHILWLDHTDKHFPSFVFKALERDKSKDKDYANLFTRALEDAWERAYLSIPPEDDEGGRYVPMRWIGCGQESSEKYLYATVRSSEHEAYISITWPDTPDHSPYTDPHPFRMIMEDSIWKLDGVKCADGHVFDSDFNYTR